MNKIFHKIDASFRAAMHGEESTDCLIWWWGAIGYFVAYFIAEKIIKESNLKSVDVVVSLLMVVYFSWHIYVLKKCSPKKPILSKEEKQKIREERRRNFSRSLLRKFFLQEPMTKWDPVFVAIVVDLFSISNFFLYVTR